MVNVRPVIEIDARMSPRLRAEAERLEALAIQMIGLDSPVERRAVVVDVEMSIELKEYLADRSTRHPLQ